MHRVTMKSVALSSDLKTNEAFFLYHRIWRLNRKVNISNNTHRKLKKSIVLDIIPSPSQRNIG